MVSIFEPMKRIGIISDTHGTFDEPLRNFLRDVDEIWHAGDIGSLDLADEIAAFKPLRAVWGNIDGGMARRVYEEFCYFRCEEVTVLMTHIAMRHEPCNGFSRHVPSSSSPATHTSSKCNSTLSINCWPSIREQPASTDFTRCAPPSA